MEKDSIEKVIADYPKLFSDVYCGFCVGGGWLPLVREIAEKINNLDVTVVQVKEKFAELRVYVRGEDWKNAQEIISEVEAKSTSICEYCGKPGKITGKFWIKTTCEEHAKE